MVRLKPSASDGLVLIAGLAMAVACGRKPDVVSGPAADYTLSLTPTALTVAQRATGNAVIAVTRTNFSGAIALSLASVPSGVTWSFNPEALGAAGSTLTVSVGAFVVPGSYNVTVTGAATAGDRSTPLVLTVTSSGGGGVATELAVGGFHACALASDGAAYCWGSNTFGQLGNGTISTGSWTPTAVSGGLRFSSIAAGGEAHSCALTSSGAAYCWGGNYYGVLGSGSNGGNSPIPVAVSGGLGFSSLSLGPGAHSCGLIGSGAAYCWGADYYGGLGDGSQTDKSTPSAVSGGLTYASLAPGGQHTCALTSAGQAFCWGWNVFGELGTGSTSAPESCMVNGFPVACSTKPLPVVAPAGLLFVALASGMNHTCGLASSGAAYCWGRNSDGQLGDGSTTNSSVPAAVSGSVRFTRLGVGDRHTCGITDSGAAYCWGYNGFGQLGNGSTTNSPVPVAVAGGLSFKSVDGGVFVTCGLTMAGAVYCWGWGSNSFPGAIAGWP